MNSTTAERSEPAAAAMLALLPSSQDIVVRATLWGSILQAFLIGLGLPLVLQYYKVFGKTDSWKTLAFIGFGAVLAIGQFGMSLGQLANVIQVQGDPTRSFVSILDSFNNISQTLILFLMVFNTAGVSYFGFKARKMLRDRQWAVAPAVAAVCASVAIGFWTIVLGYQPPSLHSEDDLAMWRSWLQKQHALTLVFLGTVVGGDLFLSATLLVLRRGSSNNQTVQRPVSYVLKIYQVAVETMIVPTAMSLTLLIFIAARENAFMWYDLIFLWSTGPSLYLGIVTSLLLRTPDYFASIPSTKSPHQKVPARVRRPMPRSPYPFSGNAGGFQRQLKRPRSFSIGIEKLTDIVGIEKAAEVVRQQQCRLSRKAEPWDTGIFDEEKAVGFGSFGDEAIPEVIVDSYEAYLETIREHCAESAVDESAVEREEIPGRAY